MNFQLFNLCLTKIIGRTRNYGQVENAEVATETEVWKPKYEVRRKAACWCLVPRWLTVSLSGMRANYWHIRLQWALTWLFSMTRWAQSCHGLIPRLWWLFASVSGIVSELVESLAKILGEEWWQHSHLHHCHENIRSIEPAWLAYSPLVLVWVWPHSVSVTSIMIAMLTAVLQP